MVKELTCIICPRGCHLSIDEALNVKGNACPRGEKYAKQEISDPRRTLTSTVRCSSSILPLCPVKTDKPVKKDKVVGLMELVNKAYIEVPVHIGDIVIADIDGEGSNLIATRELLK